jgi:hypothetical protein
MTAKDRTVTLAESDALRALPANRLDPQALISKAIEQGAGIETLERLVQLAKDVREITAREAFFAAKAEFKKRCPPIKKKKEAHIESRTGRSYSYKYSPLDEVTDVVDPPLAEVGLSYSWRHPKATMPNHVASDCILAHVLGHTEPSGPVEIPYSNDGRMNNAQSVGSALTYSKRYSLLAILGKAAEDEDDDAKTSAGDPPRARTARTGPHEGQNTPVSPARESEPRASVVMSHIDSENNIEESKTLFPTPDADRDHLIVEINSIINRVIKQKRAKPENVREWKKTYLGQEDADILKADPAALVDFSKYLLGRFGA